LTINWFPGHMVKARREIEKNIKLVDIALILLDARAPFSCRNSDLEKIARNKKVVMVLNKADLASPEAIRHYMQALEQEGFLVVAMDSLSGKGRQAVLRMAKSAFQEKAEELQRKGRRPRAIRAMVMGVPNIGKSTFLNCLVGQKIAQTGAKPGVTRGKQWVRLREDIELLDTPGLMWPRVESEEQGLKLALLDIVGENAYSEYEVGLYLLSILKDKHPQILLEKLGLDAGNQLEEEMLAKIAGKRGYLFKGGVPDLDKTCQVLLQEFRRGKLGTISLD